MRLKTQDSRLTVQGSSLGSWVLGLGSSVSGLTFVELLMAATIFSILMVGFSAHLRGGLVAWHRATTTLETLQRQRVVVERLTQDLANAVIIDPRPGATPSVVFGADTLQFYTVQPVRGPAQIFVLEGGPSPTPSTAPLHATAGAHVLFVSYRMVEGAEGSALVRVAQPVREAQQGPPVLPEDTRPYQLASGIASLHIRYAYLSTGISPGPIPTVSGSQALEWHDTWSDATQLPKLVELTIQRRGAAPLRYAFLLPAGVLVSSPTLAS